MTTYRAAVIGLGRMGSTFDDEMDQGGSIFLPYCHAPSYCASPRTDLVAGADPHDEQRQIFGDRWGLAADQLFADHREMLEKARPELKDGYPAFDRCADEIRSLILGTPVSEEIVADIKAY